MESHSGFTTRIYDYEKEDLIKLIDSNKGVVRYLIIYINYIVT
jgi:hypothetical protein